MWLQKWDIKNTSIALEFQVWNFKPVGKQGHVLLQVPKNEAVKSKF